MIASPGDVEQERDIIRNVVSEWNAINAAHQQIVLLATSWETDASPATGDRPQGIINEQILEDSDLLVACFWTRLGSPTGVAPSGTIEEIRRHVGAGKPAMLYFSSAPISPDDIDADQRSALAAVKAELRTEALFEEYRSVQEFREKLVRQLAQTITREFGGMPQAHPNLVGEPSSPSTRLSDEAKTLLLAAAADNRGHALRLKTMGGISIVAGGRDFIKDAGNPRETARWEAAFDELVNTGLLKSKGAKNQVFDITHLGFEVVDELDAKGDA